MPVSHLQKLEKYLGVKFKNEDLLKEALTHRSYLNENPKWPLSHNERLEYLGDAVLELIVTEKLFQTYPSLQEGALTSLRAALVNYQMLARIAREIDLEKYIFLSRGEARDTGKAREVILANAMEALFGAIYLDQGYEVAKTVIQTFVIKHTEEIVEKQLYRDPKSLLQEIIQEQLKITPTYRVISEEGPDHQKNFLVGVYFNEYLAGKGKGTSKQEAEARAAEVAFEILKKDGVPQV